MMPPEAKLEENLRLTDRQKKALLKLGLKTAMDLLRFFPVRYQETLPQKTIAELQAGERARVFGRLTKLQTGKTWRSRKPLASGTLVDPTGQIKVIWLYQPYLAKMLGQNSPLSVAGRVSERNGRLCFINPAAEKTPEMPTPILGFKPAIAGPAGLEPIYRESGGLGSRWFFYAVQKILKSGILKEVAESIPESILKKYNLPSLKSSLIWIHRPRKAADYLAARKRFAFEEIFRIQLQKQRERRRYEKKQSFKIEKNRQELSALIDKLPFKLTVSQEKAVAEILADFRRDYPMSRLLEGDVGSGKTAVAAVAVYACLSTPPADNRYGRLQATYMAPTEILANQHFETFSQLFGGLGVPIGLLTGSQCKKFPSKVNPGKAATISKSQLLKWVAQGQIPILIGTHSLIEKRVIFKNLAFVIIDEQHRFGAEQRAKLRKKDDILPHLLSMTATPIPRTLALTIYGDLDLTLLDEMPPGRKPVITEIVPPNKRQETYQKVRKELEAGRQVYVICPRIDEPDPEKELALNVKSVTEEAARLKNRVFPEYKIGILHSRLKKEEKEKVMDEFSKNKINILCATSVVEVGVNVPNATVIIIEGAERFGLAQLHQLRGRVLRSAQQAYCFVFTEAKSKSARERLKALGQARNGFELAEIDLARRGPGELSGRQQWGVSDLGMEALKNLKMVEAARQTAREIIDSDPELERPEHQLLKTALNERRPGTDFE